MTIKLNQDQLEALVNADADDPIVFQVDGTHGHEFQHVTLLRPHRDTLLKTFGKAWLERYLKKAVDDLQAWEITGVRGVH